MNPNNVTNAVIAKNPTIFITSKFSGIIHEITVTANKKHVIIINNSG
jgi:hypothetical protein